MWAIGARAGGRAEAAPPRGSSVTRSCPAAWGPATPRPAACTRRGDGLLLMRHRLAPRPRRAARAGSPFAVRHARDAQGRQVAQCACVQAGCTPHMQLNSQASRPSACVLCALFCLQWTCASLGPRSKLQRCSREAGQAQARPHGCGLSASSAPCAGLIWLGGRAAPAAAAMDAALHRKCAVCTSVRGISCAAAAGRQAPIFGLVDVSANPIVYNSQRIRPHWCSPAK